MQILIKINFEGIAIGSQISLELRQGDVTEVTIHNIILQNKSVRSDFLKPILICYYYFIVAR